MRKPLIIDVHGHYTTAPAALGAWRDLQIAALKDPNLSADPKALRISDDEIREGIRLLAETTGIFTETAGGVTVGVLKKLAERGELKDGEKVVVYITGEGLKTLDANRDSFALTEIDPTPDSFESNFGQEVAA